MKKLRFAFAAVSLFWALSAQASVLFDTGNNPQTDQPALFHDSCASIGCVDGPALTVIGHLQFSDILVDLTSPTNLTAVDPGHNSVSTPLDAGFNTMSIRVPGYSFTSIILQLTSLSTVPDGTVTFTAHTVADGDVVSSALLDAHTVGNYYTITANGGSLITSLDLSTMQLQHDISQIRIGSQAFPTPEPGTFGLVGFALAAAGLFFRRRRT